MCCKNMDREQLKLGDFFAFPDSDDLYLYMGDKRSILVYSNHDPDSVGRSYDRLYYQPGIDIKVDLDVFDKETGEIVRRI